ncbi:lactococcin 972 family bacteriocin [Micromonospora sp. BQ11]|uniref:lactococcin 972 family bacteriocin n=1 Tax=Micromonospora sp. BQ11 TaxID=3452212 RepID=UPI003F8B1C40
MVSPVLSASSVSWLLVPPLAARQGGTGGVAAVQPTPKQGSNTRSLRTIDQAVARDRPMSDHHISPFPGQSDGIRPGPGLAVCRSLCRRLCSPSWSALCRQALSTPVASPRRWRRKRLLRIRKTFAAVVIGASAVTAMAAPAMADRQYVGGGTWDYGFTGLGSIVYSNYYHPSTDHGSSVQVAGITYRSACVGPGTWSHVQKWSAVSGNRAFWRYC